MGCYVYVGKIAKQVVYVGTTIQKPEDRFRWHRNNGKKFDFEVILDCTNEEQMLELEYNLIKALNPQFNKITHRKQNLNKKLSDETVNSRVDNPEWCQCCLKRRVNKGYTKCKWCS